MISVEQLQYYTKGNPHSFFITHNAQMCFLVPKWVGVQYCNQLH